MSHRQLEAPRPSVLPNGSHPTFAGLEENADQLRKHFGIPGTDPLFKPINNVDDFLLDLTTRTGLKKIHLDFDSYTQRLDECYARALATSDTTTAMLVCTIWTKMAADALLHGLLCASDI